MGKVIRPINDNRPITIVAIGKPKSVEINGKNTIQIEEAYQCPALIDTGATSTVISQKIADLLKLEEVGKTNIMSASHDFVEVYMYDVAVGISV